MTLEKIRVIGPDAYAEPSELSIERAVTEVRITLTLKTADRVSRAAKEPTRRVFYPTVLAVSKSGASPPQQSVNALAKFYRTKR